MTGMLAMRKAIVQTNTGSRHALMLAAASLAIACAHGSQAASQPQKGGAIPDEAQVQTATTHPMKYLISLPKNWSADRQWPVLVAPSAHYAAKSRTIELFAPERDRRKASFIIVAPFVINADPVAKMMEYRGAVMDSIIRPFWSLMPKGNWSLAPAIALAARKTTCNT